MSATSGGCCRFSAGPVRSGTAACRNLILPSLTLGSVLIGPIARLTRTAVLEVLGADYVRTARAKGLRERIVIVHHALRNALIPVVTLIGLQAAICSAARSSPRRSTPGRASAGLRSAPFCERLPDGAGRDHDPRGGVPDDQPDRRRAIRFSRSTGGAPMNMQAPLALDTATEAAVAPDQIALPGRASIMRRLARDKARGAGGDLPVRRRAGGDVRAVRRALRSLRHRPCEGDSGAERQALVRHRHRRARRAQPRHLRRAQHAGDRPDRRHLRRRARRLLRHPGGVFPKARRLDHAYRRHHAGVPGDPARARRWRRLSAPA